MSTYSRIIQIVHVKSLNYPILKFRNRTAFYKLLRDTSELNKVKFYSLLKFYNQLEYTDNLDYNLILNELSGDSLLIFKDGVFYLNNIDFITASFVSPEGIYQIGDTIIRIYPNRIVLITNGDYKLLKKKWMETNSSKSVIVFNSRNNVKHSWKGTITRKIGKYYYKLEYKK